MGIKPRRTAVLVSAAAVAGALALGIGLPALAAGSSATAADASASLAEDYVYPNADQVTGIKLLTGDGHIQFVGCDQGRTSVEVYSFTAADPFCFQILGTTGFLTMQLDEVYGIRNYQNYGLQATVSIAGATPVPVSVPADDWKGVGEGAGQGQAVLLELRA